LLRIWRWRETKKLKMPRCSKFWRLWDLRNARTHLLEVWTWKVSQRERRREHQLLSSSFQILMWFSLMNLLPVWTPSQHTMSLMCSRTMLRIGIKQLSAQSINLLVKFSWNSIDWFFLSMVGSSTKESVIMWLIISVLLDSNAHISVTLQIISCRLCTENHKKTRIIILCILRSLKLNWNLWLNKNKQPARQRQSSINQLKLHQVCNSGFLSSVLSWISREILFFSVPESSRQLFLESSLDLSI